MSRVKRGVTSHAKHKKVYKAAKGFRGRRKNTIRAAKAAVDKAGQYAFRARKLKKRTFRALWIARCCRISRSTNRRRSRRLLKRPKPHSRRKLCPSCTRPIRPERNNAP